ncbi:MAG: MnmC family methyltransferase [Vampirovibrionales bacterium]
MTCESVYQVMVKHRPSRIEVRHPWWLPDGSFTLAETSEGQLFHNKAGAWVEATGLYTHHTLAWLAAQPEPPQTLHLLDACFGLGYNTWAFLLGLRWVHQGCPRLSDAMLAHPLWQWWYTQPPERLAPLHTLTQVSIMGSDTAMIALSHLWGDALTTGSPSPWEIPHPQSLFHLSGMPYAYSSTPQYEATWTWDTQQHTLCQVDWSVSAMPLQTWVAALRPALWHCIYHDPFSHRVLPELWTPELFQHYKTLLAPEGLLITYSCAGVVQRALKATGFSLSSTQQIGKKRSGGLLAQNTLHGTSDTHKIIE